MTIKRLEEKGLVLRFKPENASKIYVKAVFANNKLIAFNQFGIESMNPEERVEFMYKVTEETLAELDAQKYERAKRCF